MGEEIVHESLLAKQVIFCFLPYLLGWSYVAELDGVARLALLSLLLCWLKIAKQALSIDNLLILALVKLHRYEDLRVLCLTSLLEEIHLLSVLIHFKLL